jgi:hypothetical protein
VRVFGIGRDDEYCFGYVVVLVWQLVRLDVMKGPDIILAGATLNIVRCYLSLRIVGYFYRFRQVVVTAVG